jgi:hypothetical protein
VQDNMSTIPPEDGPPLPIKRESFRRHQQPDSRRQPHMVVVARRQRGNALERGRCGLLPLVRQGPRLRVSTSDSHEDPNRAGFSCEDFIFFPCFFAIFCNSHPRHPDVVWSVATPADILVSLRVARVCFVESTNDGAGKLPRLGCHTE